MSEIDDLVSELEHEHAGQPWHGPSRAAVLADVSAAEAARRPPGGAHSIWELVLHMTAWTGEVARRLGGNVAAEPPEGDWPSMPSTPTDEAWTAAKHALDDAHRELVAALRAFPPGRLGDIVRTTATSPEVAGVSFAMSIRGVLQHDAYHTGQVAILKRVLRGR